MMVILIILMPLAGDNHNQKGGDPNDYMLILKPNIVLVMYGFPGTTKNLDDDDDDNEHAAEREVALTTRSPTRDQK